MAFPDDPIDLEVGLFLNGQWVDAVDNGVLARQAVQVTHGRANWAGQVDPGVATFMLDNRDGRWSPDNPTGPHFGNYKRNIPARVGVGRGDPYLGLTGNGADVASGPDLDTTADIDVRIWFRLHKDAADIDEGGIRFRLAHKSTGANGWEWAFYHALGTPVSSFSWRDSGGTSHARTTQETGTNLPWSFQHELHGLRVTLDVSSGTLTWYTMDGVGGSWVQLGNPIVHGATSILNNTAPVRVGGNPADAAVDPLPGEIHAFELRDGIGGTVQANPDFTAQTVGATSFTDAAGAAWTIGAGGRITNKRWRFHGELSSLPVRYDTQGRDVWAPVEASGLLRRLRRGGVLESALRRAVTRSATNLVQYWPMEETGTATQFGAAVGTNPMTIVGDGTSLAANSEFNASKPIGTPGDAVWTAVPDSYSPATDWQVRWLQHIPTGSTGTALELIEIETSDITWVVQWRDTGGGDLQLVGRRGSDVYTSGWVQFNSTGKAFRMNLSVVQNGANVDVNLQAQEEGQLGAGINDIAAVAGTAGAVTQIRFNKDSDVDGFAFGHLTLQNAATSTTELADELNAHSGENAAKRVLRLCTEEGIACRIEGEPMLTETMGPQRPNSLADLLQECADADLGILGEARESMAVKYRTRRSMQAQAATVAIDNAVGELGAPLQPDRDDQGFVNDWSVESVTGGTARAVLDDGSDLSISEPPVGAGRYPSLYSVNATDDRLHTIAGRLLNLSAVDEPRVSRLIAALHTAPVVASATLTDSLLTASIGDLVTVANNLPVALGTTTVRQLMQGTRDRIENFGHQIVMNTSPASPWDAADAEFLINEPWPIDTFVVPTVTTGTNGVEYTIDPATSKADWNAALAAIAADTNRGGHVIRFLAGIHDDGGGYRVRGDTPAGGGNYHGATGNHNTVTCDPGAIVKNTVDFNPIIDIAAVDYWNVIGCNLDTCDQFAGIRVMAAQGDASSRLQIVGNTITNTEHACIAVQGWFASPYRVSRYVDVVGNVMDSGSRARANPEFNEGIYIGTGATEWVDLTSDILVAKNVIDAVESDSIELKTGTTELGPIVIEDNVIRHARLVAGTGGTSIPVGHITLIYANTTRSGGDIAVDVTVRRNRIYDMDQVSGSVRGPIVVGRGGCEVYSNIVWDCQAAEAVHIDSGAGGMGTGTILVEFNTSDKTLVVNTDSYGSLTQQWNIPDQAAATFVGPTTGTADQGQGEGSGFAITSLQGTASGTAPNDCTDTAANSPPDPGALAVVP